MTVSTFKHDLGEKYDTGFNRSKHKKRQKQNIRLDLSSLRPHLSSSKTTSEHKNQPVCEKTPHCLCDFKVLSCASKGKRRSEGELYLISSCLGTINFIADNVVEESRKHLD